MVELSSVMSFVTILQLRLDVHDFLGDLPCSRQLSCGNRLCLGLGPETIHEQLDFIQNETFSLDIDRLFIDLEAFHR